MQSGSRPMTALGEDAGSELRPANGGRTIRRDRAADVGRTCYDIA